MGRGRLLDCYDAVKGKVDFFFILLSDDDHLIDFPKNLSRADAFF